MIETRMVALPEEVCARVEQKFGHRFASLEELITLVLTELLRDDATVMDEKEQKIIEERLRALGYV